MKRTFTLNVKVTLFSLVCLLGFVNLGFWQLDREAQKLELLSSMEFRQSKPSLTAGQLQEHGDLHGLPVKLAGRYEAPVLLLDNKVLNGEVGFEAHQLFREDSGTVFIVNRGFVPMGRTRETRVQLDDLRGRAAVIEGEVFQPDRQVILLDQVDVLKEFPAIVQRIDFPELIESVGEHVYPHVIRLNKHQMGSLPRHWPKAVMSPAKHRGYAIQWFAMSVAVSMAWIGFSFRVDEKHDQTPTSSRKKV